MKKALLVRKMSALEYYYKMQHGSQELHDGHKENGHSIKKIEEILRGKNWEFDTVTRDELPGIGYQDYNYVISAGGDGTVIAVASYNLSTPQLNLKTASKSRGVLCQDNIERALDSLSSGNYNIERWTRQDVILNGNLVGRALNETCVGEEMDFSKMARYDITLEKVSGTETGFWENSGLVVVTGTGSTGWPSGFSAFSRDYPQFRFRTILPVLGEEHGELVSCRLVYKGHNGKFAIDTIKYDLARDSVLEIRKSEYPLLVVNTK